MRLLIAVIAGGLMLAGQAISAQSPAAQPEKEDTSCAKVPVGEKWAVVEGDDKGTWEFVDERTIVVKWLHNGSSERLQVRDWSKHGVAIRRTIGTHKGLYQGEFTIRCRALSGTLKYDNGQDGPNWDAWD